MADSTQEDQETQPNTENKVDDAELLAVDDDIQLPPPPTTTAPKKDLETKPDTTKDDNNEEKKDQTKDKNNSKEESKSQTENKVENKVENKEENKVETKNKDSDEESELSSSDDEDELITNTEEWDITFKLAQFLDNHFILELLKHLKNQKKLLKQKQNNTITPTNTDTQNTTITNQTSDDEDNKDDQKENKTTLRLENISLISEKLMSLYNDEDIHRIEYELLSKTCLIDQQLELFDVLSDTKKSAKESLTSHKGKVLEKLRNLERICGPLIDFLGDNKSVSDLMREKSFNLQSICVKGGEHLSDLLTFNIDNLFAYCRLRYEIGYYQDTDILLGYYRMLTPDLNKKNAALWGQLSAQILQNKWDDAFKAIRDIREHIEDSSRTLNLVNKTDGDEAITDDEGEDEWTKKARALLSGSLNSDLENLDDTKSENENSDDEKSDNNQSKKQSEKINKIDVIASIMSERAWLLHWSLFVFFNRDVLLDELIALFLNNKYMNVIQTMCPHLLRYLTSAVLISPNIDKQSKLKYLTDVSKIIAEEQHTYRDPITEFVRLVMRKNDFLGASVMLGYAMDVIKCDFFLAYYQDYFLQYARCMLLIKYCKLYNRISVGSIRKLLLFGEGDGDGDNVGVVQLWLINAIRSENIDAKLDVVENVIYVRFEETNPYQLMKDRTKSMQQRTRVLYQDINHKIQRLNEMMQ